MITLLLMTPFFLLMASLGYMVKKLQSRGRRSPINESILRVPGLSIRRAQNSKAFDMLAYAFGVMLVPVLGYAAYQPENPTGYLIAVSLGVITIWLFYRAIKSFRQAVFLHQAIDAEVTAGQELNFLMRDGAWVYHDIPYQYGNIDHVVIGSGGVFAVETKGFSKPTNKENSGSENATVRIENQALLLPHARTEKPIAQAKTHAKWLRNEIKRRFGLTVPVRAVVALPGWMIKGGFDGECWVVNPKRGNALRGAVTKSLISESQMQLISSWVEDLARSETPRSKKFDAKSELM